VEFEEPYGQRSPIDALFRSNAEHVGDGLAVILSGAGADGAIGVRAVKEAGGIILVQDPNEAEFPSMPRAAIATGAVDFVLSVEEIAARTVDLIEAKLNGADLSGDGTVDEDVLRRVMAHLRVRTGHDFSKYKRSTVLRRITRRMQVTRAESIRNYYDALRESPDEPQALLSELLISVTTFFRDGEAFDTLRKLVIPLLFREEDTPSLRVWVPGCATGEEAYSVAIMLLEEASRHELRPLIQVFGSDLDARALQTAREGRYPSSIEVDVSEERLKRFFVREGSEYRIRQEVRDVVLFAVHDLLKDPPFSHVDMISCRNLLIYLDRDLQEQVAATFNYALRASGYLFLGGSESADNPPGLFRMIDRNARIYQSTRLAGQKPLVLPNLLGPIRLRDYTADVARGMTPGAALSEAAIHRRAIEKIAPPSILVDQTHRVLHMSDNAGRFVQPSGGPMSVDIVDLVRPELRFELRTALNRIYEQKLPSLSLPIPVRFNGHPTRVQLLVKSADDVEANDQRHAVVMFIEGDEVTDEVPVSDGPEAGGNVRQLKQELELTQARLRTVREDSDAANEELRAANEELQSINEEYRSTSEELETSKEELQSINEELQTVNAELKLKLETISQAHSDLQNLMASTDYGTLFLDTKLRIKRFTSPVVELFSITSADEGRPITDFAHQLDYTDLASDARALIADLTPIRREVKSQSGRWYDLRMRPYRTVDDRIDGVVITFVDVTAQKKATERMDLLVGELQHRTRNLLAVVQSISLQTIERSSSLADFKAAFTHRLNALSRLQSLISQTDAKGVSFGSLVRLELEALGAGDRVTIDGPEVALPPDTIQTLALALHELATNAQKYGALSSTTGTLAIRWELRNNPAGGRVLSIRWFEDGTQEPPGETTSSGGGYGRLLIEKALPYTIQAKTTFELGNGKLRCSIEVPLQDRS
jgi:two-component system CheB/CheR fusion protein